jgi:hypothetical protein
LFAHVEKEGTHIKYLAMVNTCHTKKQNPAMNYHWISFICNSIGKPELVDELVKDPHLPFDPG